VATLNDIQKKLEDLQKQFERAIDEGLNVVNPFKGSNAQQVIDNLGSMEDAVSAIEREFKNVNAEILESTSGLKSLSERFADISKELGKFQGGLKSANKSYNKIVGLSEQLADAQFDLTKTDSKSLKSLQFKVDLEFKRLRQQKQELQNQIDNEEVQGRELDKAKELLAIAEDSEKSLENRIGYQDNFNSAIEETIKRQKRINKATGLTGKILGGLGNLFEKAGFGDMAQDIQLAKNEMSALAVELTNNGEKSAGLIGQFKIMGKGLGSLFKSIASSLSDPLVILGLLVKAVKFLYESLTFAKVEAKEAALATSGMFDHHYMDRVSDAATATNMLFADTLAASNELRKNLGFLPAGFEKVVEQVHVLTKGFGLSGQQAANLNTIANDLGVSLDDMPGIIGASTGEFQAQTGFTADTQKAMELIGSSSAIVRNNMRGNAQELIKASSHAALMRMSLDDIRNAAEGTLDFQSSIRKEMEAEMFLQKDLNLDAYRHAALTGNVNDQAKELQKLIKQNYKGLKGNTLAQQSFADALGISREQLAESIDSMEIQQKLGFQSEHTQKRLNQLMSQGLSKEQALVQMKKEGAEGMKKAIEEEMAQSNRIAKIQEDFKQAVAGLAESLEGIIKGVADFFKSPGGKLFAKIAAMAIGGALVIKAGKSLIELFAGGIFKQGGIPNNPLYVYDVNNSGGGGDLLDNVVGKLGSRWTRSMKWTKNISKVFGGKNTYMGRQLRNLSAMFGKRSSFINQIVKNSSTLSKIFPKLSTLNSKLPQSIAMQIGKTLRVDKAGNVIKMADTAVDTASAASKTGFLSKILPKGLTTTLTKAAPMLTKTLKVLGPLGAVADLAIGGFTGASQADLSAEEQRAAGVREGIGKGEAATLGVLTGGAEKGSMFTEMLGGEKGSAGDELLGIGMAAGRGALAGAAIGSVVPVVGTAIGGAVGAVVGTVAEGFKVFSDPNSSLRKGLDAGLDWIGNKVSEGWDYATEKLGEGIDWLGEKASQAGEWISETASSIWEGTKDLASSAGEWISSTASNMWEGTKDLASSAWEGTKDLASSAWSGVKSVGSSITGFFGFANGGIAPGGFQAFANGGTVTSPTLGMVGEGRYNEAIVPLPDGKSIPVQMTGGGNNETVTLLKELIAVVRQGGDIIIDGKKVGEAIAMTTSRMG